LIFWQTLADACVNLLGIDSTHCVKDRTINEALFQRVNLPFKKQTADCKSAETK
jgi:triphosphoribosyl-dephospho-CoA synthetase